MTKRKNQNIDNKYKLAGWIRWMDRQPERPVHLRVFPLDETNRYVVRSTTEKPCVKENKPSSSLL